MEHDNVKKPEPEYLNIVDDMFMNDEEPASKKLANRITLFRALLIPVFISFLLYEQPLHALITFIIAAITDFIDGIVARRWHQQTPLGAMLDPLADKILITSAFIVLSIRSPSNLNPIPLWLTVLVITRDTMIIAISIIVHMTRGDQNIAPSVYGKIATATQVSMIGLILVFNNITAMPFLLRYFIIAIVASFTLLSGLHYLFRTAGGK